MALDSMQEIFDKIQAGRKPFWQVVRDTDVEERQVTAEASFEKMHATWRAMVESVDTYRADRRSVSGLVGGDAQRMWDYAAQQETLCGPYLQEVIATALCVAESNACMHRIVAAPTAGACGVLPAVLVPLYRRGAVDEEAIVRALYVAAGIGAVVGYRASISGASGGCQAEVGTAAAMAAGALVPALAAARPSSRPICRRRRSAGLRMAATASAIRSRASAACVPSTAISSSWSRLSPI